MSCHSFLLSQWLSSLQYVTCPQAPERQGELVNTLKDHSVLNRFRYHKPQYTNATHCKKLMNTYRSKAYLTEKLAKELVRNFRRFGSDINPKYTQFALRDKVPFLAKRKYTNKLQENEWF